jgi:hypothetical protein
LVIFQIEIEEELKEEIRKAFVKQEITIREEEEFAVIVDGRCFVGNRVGKELIIGKIISKVL